MWNKSSKSNNEIRVTLDNIYAIYLEVLKNFDNIKYKKIDKDTIQYYIKSKDSDKLIEGFNLCQYTSDDILAACKLILNAKLLGKIEDEDSKRMKKISDDLNDKFGKLKELINILKKGISELKQSNDTEKYIDKKKYSISSSKTNYTDRNSIPPEMIEMKDFSQIQQTQEPEENNDN